MHIKKFTKHIFLIVIIFSTLSSILITSKIISNSNPPPISKTIVTEHESIFFPHILPTQVTPVFESEIFKTNQDSIAVASSVDRNDNLIVVGYTRASNIITKNAYQNYLDGNYDIFLSKYTSEGNLLWSTYLGGRGNDIAFDLKINNNTNEIYITGWTASSNFPILNPKNSTLQGNWDLFLSSFNANGQLTYSTYWGTTEGDEGLRMAINFKNTELAIVGTSDNQILILKYDLINQLFTDEKIIGGSGLDIAWDVVYDIQNSLYITGDTQSANFPILNALQNSYSGNQDGFIQKYANNMTLLYSSYIGGSNRENIRSIASMGSDTVIIGGSTKSSDYPGQISVHGNVSNDTIIMSLINLSKNHISSIEISGNNDDQLLRLIVANDSVYFIARTKSTNGLVLYNPFQQSYGGGLYDGLIGKVSSNLDSIQFLSYFGNNGDDQILDLSLTKNNVLIIVGRTNSSEFMNSLTSGFKNSFITKIGDFSDTDEDGMPLWFETKYGLNPFKNDSNQDKDNDLMTNEQEYFLNFNPINQLDGLADQDNDKITNGWEVKYGLNPFNNSDSLLSYDGDHLTNYVEFLNNFDPHLNDKYVDYDGDGLENYYEAIFQLNPRNSDTDGDGFNDFVEVQTLGFLGSSASQTNDNPIIRIAFLVILATLIYLIYIFSAIIYTDRKTDRRMKNEKKIKDIQFLIDDINQDYAELANQINIIENSLKSVSADSKEILIIKKTFSSLFGSVNDLERQKIKLNSYRNNSLLKDSISNSIFQITNILTRYKNLQQKIENYEKDNFLLKSTGSLCSKCGSVLNANSQECNNCHTTVNICDICKKGIFSFQEVSECINCNHLFHYGHFAETVKIQGRCPICLVSVLFDQLAPIKK